jgi:hypothetical protein
MLVAFNDSLIYIVELGSDVYERTTYPLPLPATASIKVLGLMGLIFVNRLFILPTF